MSQTFQHVRELVARREVRISDHGYYELADDDILIREIVAGVPYVVETMTKRPHTKLIHEGQYAVKTEVELIETDEGWSPYLSLEDAQKLDEVRMALRRGDLKKASQLARIFQLTPVSV